MKLKALRTPVRATRAWSSGVEAAGLLSQGIGTHTQPSPPFTAQALNTASDIDPNSAPWKMVFMVDDIVPMSGQS